MGSCPASGSTVAWYHQIPHRRLMLVVYPAMAVAAVLLLVLVVIALRSSREETLPNKTRRQSLKDRVDIQAEVEVLDPPSSSITSPSFLFRQWDTRRCKGPPVDVKLPTWKPVTLPPYVSARWTDWWCGWAHQERLKCSTLRPRWLKTSGKCGAQMKKGWEEWQFQRFPACLLLPSFTCSYHHFKSYWSSRIRLPNFTTLQLQAFTWTRLGVFWVAILLSFALAVFGDLVPLESWGPPGGSEFFRKHPTPNYLSFVSEFELTMLTLNSYELMYINDIKWL